MDMLTNIDLFVVVSKLHVHERYSARVHLTPESAQEELDGMDHGRALPMKQHYTVVDLYDHVQAVYNAGWNEGYAVAELDVTEHYTEKL